MEMDANRQPWWRTARELCVEAWRVARERAKGAAWLTGSVAAGVAMLALFDARAREWIIGWRSEGWLAFARQVSEWGKFHLVPLFVLVTLWAWGRLQQRRELRLAAGAALLAMIGASLLTDVIKWFVGRPRPYAVIGDVDGLRWFQFEASLQSFPSGHATHCCALVAAVAMLVGRGTTVALASLAGLVMWSRYYVSAHYPSDLLAGAWVGTAFGLAFGLAARRWLAKNAGGKT
jgi:membrane-associated phospholipid phosphatase